jgi:hypothetical protein
LEKKMTDITILSARKIITMNSYRAEATHVAISKGRILGVGTAEDLAGWGAAIHDNRFSDKVLMPGFVEGHCHAKEGGVWDQPYIGYLDRRDPDGVLWPGAASMEAVIARLSEIERDMGDPSTPLFAWGFDPIYFDGARMMLGYRSGLGGASDRGDALERTCDQREFRSAVAGRDFARYQCSRRRHGCRWQPDR